MYGPSLKNALRLLHVICNKTLVSFLHANALLMKKDQLNLLLAFDQALINFFHTILVGRRRSRKWSDELW